MLNPVPAATTLEICTTALPELVSVMLCEALLPEPTFPKFTLAGFVVNCPADAAVPVPVNPMTSAGPLPLLVTMIVPVALPTLVGANFVDSTAVCDGFRVVGTVTPLTVNPAPVAVTLEILTATLPVFVSVIFCEALFCAATFPKLRLVGFAAS